MYSPTEIKSPRVLFEEIQCIKWQIKCGNPGIISVNGYLRYVQVCFLCDVIMEVLTTTF